jgi:Tfp pilus assembly protein PilE
MNGATPLVATASLERATIQARREAVSAELLEAMRVVERYRGALAILDELLGLEDPAA